MKLEATLHKTLGIAASLALLLASGCHWKQYYERPTAAPLGTLSDEIWQGQEAGAETSDFVVYQHEFLANAQFLNTDGEDHVKQIAARLADGQDVIVTVERSKTTPRRETEYSYPVHVNSKLDMRRREIIVRSLEAMGVADAEERVVVAPAAATGMRSAEAEAAFHQTSTAYGGRGASWSFSGGSRF
jgi:hypothetical protein